MRYKEIVILEDLIEYLNPEYNYKLCFILENETLFTGDFRKPNNGSSTDEYSFIDSEKLLNDYKSFIFDNEWERKHLTTLFEHVQEDVIYKKEKLENYLLISMCVFLTDEGFDLDDYLVGYDGLEIIYNFTTMKDSHEEFVLDGREVEPLWLYELPPEIKL